MATKKTTIYTMSKIAGVAPSTISKALNNSGDLSEEMRHKIQKLSKELNFSPRVVTKKTQSIGVLMQQKNNHPSDFGVYLAQILEGISEYCQEQGLGVNIVVANIDQLNKMDIIKEFWRRNIDAAILLRCDETSDYIKQLEDSNFPYCMINCTHPFAKNSSIITDFESVGACAGNYLKSRGHKDVGIIVSPSSGISGKLRLAGFLTVFSGSAVVLADKLEAILGFEAGRKAVYELFKKSANISAIFVTGFEPTLGAVYALKELEKRIPEDISLISCDNYPASSYLTPAITTIDTPIKKLGFFAATQVHRLLSKKKPLICEEHIDLNGKIIERNSVKDLRA